MALKFVLPWHLQQLKTAGFRGVKNFVEEGKYNTTLGVPFEQQAWKWIETAVASAGESLRASFEGGEQAGISNKQIRVALGIFSTHEWRKLIGEFDLHNCYVLRTYLEANKVLLMEWLGCVEFNDIVGHEINRVLTLSFERKARVGYKTTVLTDAMWTAHIRRDSRRRNIRRVPRPSLKRSWSEVGGLKNIAESLSSQGHDVSPHKAKMMLARMEQTSFEAFDGNHYDYFLWATDPKAYERHRRLKETAMGPYRDPDPHFVLSDD